MNVDDSVMAAPLEVLLVEDNPADVRMTREALAATHVLHRLHVVEDGESALAFLRREGAFGASPQPDVMLLDLSLPRMTGHEVLRALRASGAPKRFPIVVLTGSRQEKDLVRSFEYSVDEHITKPATLPQYVTELSFALSLARPRAS